MARLDCKGKYLDEVIPPKNHGHRHCALFPGLEDRPPKSTPFTTLTDRTGRLIHFERLLLPFSCDGESIDRILAAFDSSREDGAFDSADLMTTLTVPPALRLSATIEAQIPV